MSGRCVVLVLFSRARSHRQRRDQEPRLVYKKRGRTSLPGLFDIISQHRNIQYSETSLHRTAASSAARRLHLSVQNEVHHCRSRPRRLGRRCAISRRKPKQHRLHLRHIRVHHPKHGYSDLRYCRSVGAGGQLPQRHIMPQSPTKRLRPALLHQHRQGQSPRRPRPRPEPW